MIISKVGNKMNKIKSIHNLSIRILEEIGVEINSEKILKILKKEGIKINNDRMFLNEANIEYYLKDISNNFQFRKINNEKILIGKGNREYLPGYGAANILDGNSIRNSREEDYIKILKIIQASDFFNINGGILCDFDENSRTKNLKMVYNTFKYTNKGFISPATDKLEAEDIVDVFNYIYDGDLKNEKRILSIINSTSPLKYDKETLEILEVYAENNQPLIITPAAMIASTGPVTISGSIAMSNAEVLAGIVISQVINKGCPVVYGFQTSGADMKTGAVALGDPVTSIFVKYGAKLADFYGLPSRGGGSNTDALYVGTQSSYEGAMALLETVNSGMNLIFHSAGMLSGNGIVSINKLIVDLEIIKAIEYIKSDITSIDVEVDFEEIKKNHEKGEFLTSEYTFSSFRDILFQPEIGIRGFSSDVQTQKTQTENNIKSKENKLLKSYQMPYNNKKALKFINKKIKDDKY